MKIIFKNKDNSVGVLIPTQECINMIIDAKTTDWDNPFTFRQALLIIAEKDVPKDLPYKIVSVDAIPTDRTYRNAWEWDNSIEPDGFGGESNEFDDELLAKYKGIK